MRTSRFPQTFSFPLIWEACDITDHVSTQICLQWTNKSEVLAFWNSVRRLGQESTDQQYAGGRGLCATALLRTHARRCSPTATPRASTFPAEKLKKVISPDHINSFKITQITQKITYCLQQYRHSSTDVFPSSRRELLSDRISNRKQEYVAIYFLFYIAYQIFKMVN